MKDIGLSPVACEIMGKYEGLLAGRLMTEQRSVLELMLSLNPDKLYDTVVELYEEVDFYEHSHLVSKLRNNLDWVKIKDSDTNAKYKLRFRLAKQIISFFSHLGGVFDTYESSPRFYDGKWHKTVEYRLKKSISLPQGKKLFDTKPPKVERRSKRTLYGPGKKQPKLVQEFSEWYQNQELLLVKLDFDTLMKFVKQRKDYNSESARESIDQKYMRFKGYATSIIKFYDTILYHSLPLEQRGRARYVRNLNPLVSWFGSENENAMWEAAQSIKLNAEGLEELQWGAVILTIDKHCSLKQGLRKFKANEEKILEELFRGKEATLYTMRLATLIREGVGTETRFLYGVDATNGGQSHMGTSWRSVEFLKSSNFQGLLVAQDSHQDITNMFNKLYGYRLLMQPSPYRFTAPVKFKLRASWRESYFLEAPRKYVKKKNQEKEHGSGTKSVTSKDYVVITKEEELFHVGLNEIYNYYGSAVVLDYKDVDAVFREKLGACYSNIDSVAEYGVELAKQGHLVINWRLPDGFIATHQAYKVSETFNVHALSPDGKQEQVTITSNMPIEFAEINRIMYDDNSRNKVRGLLANITHSIDGYVARVAILQAMKLGMTVLYKHDKFFMHPNNIRTFRKLYGEVMKANFNLDLFGVALKEIEYQTGVPAPEMIYGTATVESMFGKDMTIQPFLVA